MPYDFDQSGVVNAHYAVVSATLPLEEITDRYYLGDCSNDESISSRLSYFKNK